MSKKISFLVLITILSISLCGCVALLAGAAAGAGTASWLSGKLIQEVNASFEKTIQASKQALGSLKLKVTKETIKDDTAQIMGNYTDGKTIWIDIHRVSAGVCRLEVRVGAASDKDAARKILNKIAQYL